MALTLNKDWPNNNHRNVPNGIVVGWTETQTSIIPMKKCVWTTTSAQVNVMYAHEEKLQVKDLI